MVPSVTEGGTEDGHRAAREHNDCVTSAFLFYQYSKVLTLTVTTYERC